MERENMKGKIALTVIGAATLLVALAGATFAYFSATSTTTTQTVTTSSMDLTVEADTNTTHIENIKPTTWSDTVSDNVANSDIAKVSFKVTSTSTAAGTYQIKMTAPGLALNTGNDADGNKLVGGTLDQVMYKVYKVNGSTYTPVTATEATGDLSDPSAAKLIVTDAAISGTLNDQYVIFVYIENDDKSPQNQLQGLDFEISVTGSAAQA